MNRQERYAYELGWAARCLELPLETVYDLPLRQTLLEVVMPGEAWKEHVVLGYRDAVCFCGHTAEEHTDGYGCRATVEVVTNFGRDVLECFCTGFASKTKRQREDGYRRRAEARREYERRNAA